MKMKVSEELSALFKKIVEEGMSREEWAEKESDDIVQSASYTGGYDATEGAF